MNNKIVAVLIGLLSGCNEQKSDLTTRIDITTLQAEVINKEVQFIDVRTPKEYHEGHIDDAINMDIKNLTSFEKTVRELDKAQPVYIYCRKGGRSNKASKVLEKMGFKEIYDFSGGWNAWNSQIKNK